MDYKKYMKKYIIIITVISLLLCGCVNEKAAQGGIVLRGGTPNEPPFAAIQLPKNEIIVYITPTGEKYHEAGCPFLSDTALPVTLEQALMENREPCSRCH